MRLPFLLCAALLSSVSLAHAQPELVSPGQQVLRACAKTYKSLREFKGSAAVISQVSLGSEKAKVASLLENSDASFDFVRDGHFNIEGHDTTRDPFTIASTPQKTLTAYGEKERARQIAPPEDIEEAVASFTGVARNAPTVVPALLLSSRWGYPFRVNEPQSTLKSPEMFGGSLCFVVVQTTKRPGKKTYWIDAKTFLLRGMREESGSDTLAIPAFTDPATKQTHPQTEIKILFSNEMHVFSIDKTLPSEDELAATAKLNPNLPRIEDQPKEN